MSGRPGRLRIVGGTHRGRRIGIPPAGAVRPTGERVREALFGILAGGGCGGPPLPGSRVLDACAGAGALGIEALSRGAAHANFLDSDRKAVAQIERNLAQLGLSERAAVRRADIRRPPPGEPCGIVFLDPPYDGDLARTAPAALAAAGWIAPGGLLVIETRRAADIDPGAAFERVATRSYADTSLHFAIRTG